MRFTPKNTLSALSLTAVLAAGIVAAPATAQSTSEQSTSSASSPVQGVQRSANNPLGLNTYTIDNKATVTPWMNSVSEQRIRADILSLSTNWPNRNYNSRYGLAASNWVKNTWSNLAAGRSDVTVSQSSCTVGCGQQPNVSMTIKGTEKPDEIVVIGGHLDSTSNSGSGDSMRAPGADDNASGTATVTEVARVALASGWKPKRTVVFAGYAAEEIGLRGSKDMAQKYRAAGKNVVGVLQFDMTNYYPGSGPDMATVDDNSDPTLTGFNRNLFSTYLAPKGYELKGMTCGYPCSDHASWTSAGYPAAMVVEPEIFPYLHTPNDTLANMGNTAQPSVKFAQFGLAFLGEVAKTGA